MVEISAAPSKLVCDKCGKIIEAKVGETYTGSTDGRVWHFGCSPSRTMTTQSPDATEEVERVARALFEHEWRGQPKLPEKEYRNGRQYWVDAARAAIKALPSNATTNEIDADSGMSGDAVADAEWLWANLPTGNKPWTSLHTHEKALVCHTLARFRSNATTNASLVEALEMARRLCDQVKLDLASAHAEICKLQGLDPATHSWPGWTPQANTLRWLDDDLIPQFDTALATLRASKDKK